MGNSACELAELWQGLQGSWCSVSAVRDRQETAPTMAAGSAPPWAFMGRIVLIFSITIIYKTASIRECIQLYSKWITTKNDAEEVTSLNT